MILFQLFIIIMVCNSVLVKRVSISKAKIKKKWKITKTKKDKVWSCSLTFALCTCVGVPSWSSRADRKQPAVWKETRMWRSGTTRSSWATVTPCQTTVSQLLGSQHTPFIDNNWSSTGIDSSLLYRFQFLIQIRNAWVESFSILEIHV